MLQVAFLWLLYGQVPPPPVPQPPDGYSQSTSAAELPSSPEARREWLLAHLIADMHAQRKYSATKVHEIEAKLNNMSASQLGTLVQYYQQRKAQVDAAQLAQAEDNLRRMQDYRDRLKMEVERRSQVYDQGRAITAYGSALAAQQAQWAMQTFYAAQAWPYYGNRPYYYAPPRYRYRW